MKIRNLAGKLSNELILKVDFLLGCFPDGDYELTFTESKSPLYVQIRERKLVYCEEKT